MKSIYGLVLLTLSFLAFATSACNRVVNSENTPTTKAVKKGDGERRTLFQITDKEKNNLDRLLPQVLLWAYRWKVRLHRPQDDAPTTAWLDQIASFDKSMIEVGFEETPSQLLVYLREFGVQVRFNRFDGENLEALRPEPIVNYPRSYSSILNMRIPSFGSPHSFLREDDNRKQQVLESVESLVAKNACFSLSNSSNEKIKITIPNFDVGDPELYVLLQGNSTEYSDGSSIDWVRFEKRDGSDQIFPILEKNFGLPDEVKSIREMIIETKSRSFEVNCSKFGGR